MPALTILIRNLNASQLADCDKRYPALESFLSRCALDVDEYAGVTRWLTALHGFEQRGDWPAGALLARAGGSADDGRYWICAQPVHLAINGDQLVLQQLTLSEEESHNLHELLAAHFADAGLEFKLAHTGLWTIAADDAQDLATTPVECAAGRSIDRLLPGGSDAGRWQRLVIEVQMLLHEHPLNAERERRGLLPVNSLWLHGAGNMAAMSRHFTTMAVSDPMLCGLAIQTGATLLEPPARAEALLEHDNSLAEFVMPAPGGPDNALAQLEANWVAPAWQALANRELDRITLVITSGDRLVVGHCTRRSRRRWWRRRRSLADFFTQRSAGA